MNNNNYCVILAGGKGTRLWPSSRQQKPKQFIDYFSAGETLLQSTYRRFSKFIDKDNIIVVSNEHYRDLVMEQLPELAQRNLLLEPMRRNTVPSVTWAAFEICNRCTDATIVVSPADQLITNEEKFAQDISRGLDYVAGSGRLLTVGISPTRAETAYGYIQMCDSMAEDIYKVKSFTEKPEMEFARLFVENKEFLWNTGIFISGARSFLETVHGAAVYYTDMMDYIQANYDYGKSFHEFVEKAFSMCPTLSLERGILEKADNVDVMVGHFGWADIGTWDALYDVMPKTGEHNVIASGRAILYDCKDSLVKLPEGRVAVVQGLEDYVIAEEDNVLVICKKDDQGAIRKFVNDVQINIGDDYV